MRDILTDPYGWALLAVLGALAAGPLLVWRGRRAAGCLTALALCGAAAGELLLLGMPPVAHALTAPLEAVCDEPPGVPGSPGVIVVLGAGVMNSRAPRSSLGPAGLARVAEAAAAARRWPEVPVLVSGGRARPGRVSGADRMLAELERLGVAPERLFHEDRARTTRGNAVRVALWLEEHGVAAGRPIALVTSAVHMPRALGAFRERGLEAVPVCAERWTWPGVPAEGLRPNAESLRRSSAAIHERFGLAWYRLRGYAEADD
ncbi:MAG: YdcF family protein [Acidobacteria bacterium]|nr:MAG: YdcF family protein [Acidobacteriota bacterium]